MPTARSSGADTAAEVLRSVRTSSAISSTRGVRRCERSEAISCPTRSARRDCFVAALLAMTAASIEPQPFRRQVVQPAPYQPVEGEHVKTQYPDPERDSGGVALGGVPRDVGAD